MGNIGKYQKLVDVKANTSSFEPVHSIWLSMSV